METIYNVVKLSYVNTIMSIILGPVVRKQINANPGLKVKQAFNLSCIKVFFSVDVL